MEMTKQSPTILALKGDIYMSEPSKDLCKTYTLHRHTHTHTNQRAGKVNSKPFYVKEMLNLDMYRTSSTQRCQLTILKV